MNVRIIDGLKQLVNILYCINVQRLVYDLMIDSIKLMLIIVEVEETFSIDSFKIVENIENIITVSDLVEAVNQVRGHNDGNRGEI